MRSMHILERIEVFHTHTLYCNMKIPSITLFIAIASTRLSSLQAEDLQYDTPVTLKGTVDVLYDMSFVDPDAGPLKDPTGIKVAFPDPSRADLQKPVRHLLLTLGKPISVSAGNDKTLQTAIKNVTEIDLGNVGPDIPDHASVTVDGKVLARAHTVHHLRELLMEVSSIKLTKAAQDAAPN